jgi:uncharacterized protein (TIGR02145 family)
LQSQITALYSAAVVPLPSVTIGTQIWSSTNLDVTTYRDGTPIPQVTDPVQWQSLTSGAWCYYNNDSANGAIYGKLYNWYAVAGIHDNDPSTPNKIFAPQGWHIPTDLEWGTLITFLGGEDLAGGKMKSGGTIEASTGLWLAPNEAATNESGFTALPGGYRGNLGIFDFAGYFDIGSQGAWWSASELNTANSWGLFISASGGWAGRGYDSKKRGFSVRCLRD